ncbi:type I 3-dehydroquinate dehydratase [Streptomyces luteolifulvus]|uniref:type I 3-dehydroquinate dehydratase n=1 Tax=Streptomyces luteolifulvus TaxID=2615112 RepID=UPI00177F030A|nr:type I 3-dehydroquinate dehydratase [Streptomyces luteolifulvus]
MELTPGSSGHRPRAPGRARLVAVATGPDDLTDARLRDLDAVADAVEIRADLAGDPDPGRLRKHFTGALTYSLRTQAHGGGHGRDTAERRTRLLRAADHYDTVELEWPDDLTQPELLAAVPAGRRRVAWHGVLADHRDTDCHTALRELFAALRAVPAALYLLAPRGAHGGYGVSAAPRLLAGLGREDVTAYTSGTAGVWTRVLAPWLGAPVVFGRASGPGPDGMPGMDQLVTDYGLPALSGLSGLFGIVGRDCGRSLAPRLYNAALRALGLPALYLPFPADDLAPLWREAVGFGDSSGLPVRGLTVTAPHKESALELADVASPTALRCGAANLMWPEDGRWRADTTDTVGALHALTRAGVRPAGLRAAVVGCGGAGRAAALALLTAGAEVTLVNRGHARGRDASRRIRVPYVPLSAFDPAGYGVLVHATPLVEPPPVSLATADPGAVVLEMAYRDPPTPLVEAARARGLLGIDGREVLLVEIREQFRMLTGHRVPSFVPLGALCGAPEASRRPSRPPVSRRAHSAVPRRGGGSHRHEVPDKTSGSPLGRRYAP